MWAAVLIFAVMAMWDPVRIGVAVLVVARPRPVANLAVFCLGGIASSVLLGLVAVFFLRGPVQNLISSMSSSDDGSGGGQVKLAFGALALLIAAVLAVRQGKRMATPGGRSPESEPAPRSGPPTLVSRLSAKSRAIFEGKSLWVAFLAGLWAGPGPHVELIGALTAILASQAASSTQAAAVVVYAVVSFAFAEIPLISFLFAPAKTSAVLTRVPEWLSVYRNGIVAAALTVLGCYLVVTSLAG